LSIMIEWESVKMDRPCGNDHGWGQGRVMKMAGLLGVEEIHREIDRSSIMRPVFGRTSRVRVARRVRAPKKNGHQFFTVQRCVHSWRVTLHCTQAGLSVRHAKFRTHLAR